MSEALDNKFLLDCARIVQIEKPSKASNLLHKVFDGLHKDIPETIECAQGCNFCCYSSVTITNTELSELALHIRTNFSTKEMDVLKAKLIATKKKYQKLNKEERITSRDLCALNIDGSCSVYEARPLYCRSAMSYSKKMCGIAHEAPETPVPMPKAPKNMADEMTVAILLGEDRKEYEMFIADGLLKAFKW
jgi:Fe-S-cluster containining protein